MRSEVEACIALGANLGDAAQALRDALAALDAYAGIRVLRASGFYRTAPVAASGPDFINAAAVIATTRTAPDLLSALQSIEQAAGRLRPYRNAPRTLDLDLLTYGAARIESPALTVPHPRMMERAFVLVPLHEVQPDSVSPEALAAVSHQQVERMP